MTTPDTVVLVHGLWMTPRSWEGWVKHYEQRGLRVIAPAYPGFEVEVEALRADPTPIARSTIEQVADHFEAEIRKLDKPPIIIGHSFGGALTQILLDRGLGAAGVAINSVQPKGVLFLPFNTIKATFPVSKNPLNYKRAVGFTHDQFHFAFTNTLSDADSRAAYERYHIPAPGRFVFEGALASFIPGSPMTINFDKPDRAPLLFIAGGKDQIMPASLNRATMSKYGSGIVAYKEYPDRDHYTCGAPGWEKVADDALAWALAPKATA
jgi:pimeloyl-ACP methyl ester carboxylesterase